MIPQGAPATTVTILDHACAGTPERTADQMEPVVALTGRSRADVEAELARLGHGPGGITPGDYVKLGLYDSAALAGPVSSFIGHRGARAVWATANYSQAWFGPMMDKIGFAALLSGFGLPTTRTIAQVGSGPLLPGSRRLADAAEIASFLAEPSVYPLFMKPQDAERSLGSASAASVDPARGAIRLLDGRDVGIEALAAEIIAHYASGYLFQARLAPALEVARLCGNRVATLRVYTIAGPDGPQVFREAWKIPAGRSMADNYWRAGNLLAAVDRDNGCVTRAVSGYGPGRREHDRHPDSGRQLVGMRVPQIDELRRLALEAAEVFHDIRLVGWDLAATAQGPVIVEGNFAPDFDLVQIAEARGVLDDQLLGALDWCCKERARFAARIADAHRRNEAAEAVL